MSPRHHFLVRDFLRACGAGLILVVGAAPILAQKSAAANGSLREARQLLSQHQAARAEAMLRPLLARDPENPTILTVLAVARLDQGDQDEATTLLLRALKGESQFR